MSEAEHEAYPCSNARCDDKYFEEENLRYWPDSGIGKPGWYCPDCLDVLLVDLRGALVSLYAWMGGNFSPWPSSAPLVIGIPDPRLLPAPHYQCHRCKQWKPPVVLVPSVHPDKWFCRRGCDT